MGRVDSRSVKSLPGVVLVAVTVMLASSSALAQSNPEASQKVVDLVKSAMDAYGNLDLENATNSLEEALGFAPDLDKTTLARLYIAYGTIRVGGSGDNPGGQHDFVTALCLDETVNIDPLMSSPDIDTVFAAAKQEATPDNCQQVLGTIVLPADMKLGPIKGKVVDPGVPACGAFTPLDAQKQRYEVPVYLDVDPMMRSRIAKIVLKFSFDGSPDFRDLAFGPAGMGYGAEITCDEGQIRVYDPTSISFYIEGYDHLGNLICGHASAQGPYMTVMSPDVPPAQAVTGLALPKECAPCPPWDQTCGQTVKPKEGDMCDAQGACAEGLVCGEAGICEAAGGGGSGESRGPKMMYFDLLAGVGVGAQGKDMSSANFITQNDAGENVIGHPNNGGGFAWSGVPLRLVVGYKVLEWLSVEVTGRLDVTKAASFDKSVQSCWDASGHDLDKINGVGDYAGEGALSCTTVDGTPPGDPGFDADLAKQSIALTNGGDPVESTTPHIGNSWLVNARARFRLLQKGGLQLSAFAGLGYGHIMYMVKSAENQSFFPAPGFFDIEVGPGLAYYFNDHVGIAVDVPIDVIVGDGWALNFDFTVGLSAGF
jgi:hypothetical protein